MEDKEGEFVDIKELPKDQKISLILNSLQIGEIIKLIGNDTKKGFIIDSKTGEKVTTPDLEYIKVKQVGAILPGSKVFIKKNIASFSKYLAEHGREDV